MTDHAGLLQDSLEAKEAYVERLKRVLQERKEQAQAEYELKRHLEDTVMAMALGGAPAAARNEMHRQLAKACVRLGVAKGLVDIAEAYLVGALNR